MLRGTHRQELTICKFAYNHASLLIFFIPLHAILFSDWMSNNYCALSVTVRNRQIELRQYMTDCKTCCVQRRDNDSAFINLFAKRLVDDILRIFCYCILGSFKLGNIAPTVNLAALYAGTRI